MSDRRPARNASPRRTAPSGAADGRRVWRSVLAWLAVFAVLIQTTIPDFAMAARAAARHHAEAVATHQTHQQHHGADHHGPESPKPADRHEHGTLCAFCLALGTHGLTPELADALPVSVDYDVAAPPLEQSVQPRPLFLTGRNPRAPPRSEQG